MTLNFNFIQYMVMLFQVMLVPRSIFSLIKFSDTNVGRPQFLFNPIFIVVDHVFTLFISVFIYILILEIRSIEKSSLTIR